MTSLADDLLKSRSIQQLTCVVQNLSNEVMNKQKELQGMVGSQYNQFIRSADKIIDMRNRSTSLIISLKDFVSQSSYISDSFDKLMQQNCLISLNKSESVLEQGVSLASIWQGIAFGDVYYPGKLIIFAILLNEQSFEVESHLKISHFKSLSFLVQDLLEACEVVVASEFSRPNRLETLGKTLLIYTVMQTAMQDKQRKSLDDFEWYIKLAEVRMEKILSKMVSPNDPSYDISSYIFSLVTFLQDSVIDLYYLFLKRFDAKTLDDRGLLSHYSRALENDVDCLISSVSSCEKLRKKFINLVRVEVSLKLVEEKIKSWISTKFKQVMESSSKILALLQDAHEVAKLQHMVRMLCSGENRSQLCILTSTDFSSSNVNFAEAWKEATAYVFGSYVRRSKHSDASEFIWISVFQVSFLQQVKRLLRINSSGIIQRIHSLIVGSLRRLGLEVDGGVVNTLQKDGVERVFSSTVIYEMAQSVQKNLSQHLASLMDDVISPIESTSSYESANLFRNHDVKQQELIRAIGETFCGLYSNLLGIIRNLLTALMEEVKSVVEIQVPTLYIHDEFLQAFLKNFKIGKGIIGGVTRSTAEILRQSALFLGRLALSLKSESDVLHLNLFEISVQQEKISDRIDFRLISEEQLKSTFEIADTNGDGIISKEEAFEAMSALSVYPFELSLDEERTFDYEEFLLMFGSRLLSTEEFVAIDILHRSLDRLLSISHMLWALILVESEVNLFSAALKKSFALPSNQLSELSVRGKIFWIARSGDSNDLASYEDFPLPLTCTTTLVTFLQKLSFEFSTLGISIDLFQFNQSAELCQQLCPFISVLSHYLRAITFASLLQAYDQLLLIFLQTEKRDALIEDCVLQGLYDLQVLSHSIPQESKLGLDFSRLKGKYEGMVDPVTLQFFLTHLRTEAEIMSKQLFSLSHIQTSQNLRTLCFDEHASLPYSFGVENTLKKLLANATLPPPTAPPKFSLLPLALTTPPIDQSNWVFKSSYQEVTTLVPLKDNSTKVGSSNSIRWW